MKEKLEEKKLVWYAERDILFAGILAGILAHGYMLTNKLPNIDDYISMFHYGQGYTLGRWLLGLMGNFMFRIDGTYSLPFLNGAFFIAALALSVTIFLKPFSFQSRWIKRIFAALFVAFPTATSTLGFMFTVPFYAIAILFMAIAFHVLVHYKYGFLFTILLICCSLGIYQAYWGLVAGFLLLYLITLCISDETKNKELITLSLKSLCALFFGVILYLIVNSIMLKWQGAEMIQYQGVSQMGQFKLSNIPAILQAAYGWFFHWIKENYLHITWYPIIRWIIAIGYVLSAVFCVINCFRKRHNLLKTMAMIGFTALLPLTINSIYILCNDASSIHTLMCYSVVLIFLMPFVFMSGVKQPLKVQVPKYAYMSALLLVTFFYIRFANIYYLNLEMAYHETYSFMETLSTRIQEADGYSEEKPILFYGMYAKGVNRNIWELRMVNNMHGSIDVDNVINSPLIRSNYSRIYLGNTFHEVTDPTLADKYAAQIKEMNSYPNDGSIAIIDDIIVVKLSDK